MNFHDCARFGCSSVGGTYRQPIPFLLLAKHGPSSYRTLGAIYILRCFFFFLFLYDSLDFKIIFCTKNKKWIDGLRETERERDREREREIEKEKTEQTDTHENKGNYL